MKKEKAVFFDRDGVINEDLGYVHKKGDFRFYDDFFACAKEFKKRGYRLVVITNQSGIDRGYFGIKDFLEISAYMQDSIFNRLGFCMDRIYFCPSRFDNARRKPACGLLLQAKQAYNLDMSACLMVGDKLSDMEAGYNAGLTRLFLISRGCNSRLLDSARHLFYANIATLSALY